jgi:hypothetical protein
MTFLANNASFPLTLTLSLGEREPQAARSDFSQALLALPALRLLKGLNTILPLPKGEGESDFRSSAAVKSQEAFR